MDDRLARYRPYLAMLLLFVGTLAGTMLLMRQPEPSELVITTPTPRPTATGVILVVDVRGAIARPGVYRLPGGSRVEDALALAGGTVDGAETRGLNLARRLADGEQINIPTLAEATQTVAAVPVRGVGVPTLTKTPIGKININLASVQELDALPGIGPALGQRIVEYREQNGPFKSIEELKKVRGIGDVLFKEIEGLVTLD